MTTEDFKTNIQEALRAFAKGNLTKTSLELFSKLGYVTERRAPLDKPTFEEFQDTYISDQRFDINKAKVKEWKYVDLLFQLSREEVSQQASLFDTKQVDKTIIETYLFFALELTGEEYNRTDLSNITREINRLFPMPVMVLFKHVNKLTFSVINRRLHKRDESKDVLEKVTLIKDISIESPLRAHIEILFDLSFQELLNKHQFTNFVELHNAWQKTLDTKELNKRFYSELFNWYLWAVQTVRFPNDVNDDKDDNVYNAESVIRLLTRLIFVWFIKEKNLVPETLFNVKKLKTILKDLKPESEKTSVYYRAILQNLFFATLNTPMDKDITEENKDEKRQFINPDTKTNKEQYLDQTKYRYQDYFINPDKALELFATIPFLNGGLFECLDFKEGNKEIRFDGFSSTEKRQAFVPDKLFFADEFLLDLNAEYGTKGKKYKVEGLINILDSYKFTIAENTPLEEEIALDPELLGKVFENLLASYNPETQTTARKQTGSFYTPREIVNYMVDESLIAYFKQKLDNSDETEQRLRDLFAHTTNLPEFSKTENAALINAISEAKILDPACGSGAFPMGVLHRLVDLLNKLDPENKHWNELQKQRAITETAEVFDSGDTEERKIRLDEINKAFDLSMNYPDYARKLFLIENCIYGVDIQQIAIQISKLRFFISLIVDQKVNDSKPNRNILSMPNLETKFVAANTLIALDKPQQMTLMAGDVERLEKELASIRHKIFFTRKYYAKKALKKKEKEKREELQTVLTQSGFSKNVAGQIAGWNPFDPMQSAKFFDPETMFGFVGGFNIVIGNPPYVSAPTMVNSYRELRQMIIDSKKYKSLYQKWDLYIPFMELGLQLLSKHGVFSMIVPYPLTNQNYGLKLRELIINDYCLKEIVDLNGTKVFENATVSNCIPFITKSKPQTFCYVSNVNQFGKIERVFIQANNDLVQDKNTLVWNLTSEKRDTTKHSKFNVLGDYCYISKGMVLNADENTAKGEFSKDDLISETYDKIHCRKYIEAKDIERYRVKKERYLEYNTKRCPGNLSRPTFRELYEQPKLMFNRLGNLMVILDDEIKYLHSDSMFSAVLWKDLDGVVNKSISASVKRYSNLSRKEMSKLSVGINLRYLLGVLNSKYASVLLTNLRGGDYHIYPEHIRNIPIPNVAANKQKQIISLVDQIISAKKTVPSTDTSELEKQIDEMVYKLYDLTEEEIKIIEGGIK
ncbi:MAG: N-6 DNA methylase [Bacteroidales bacterium]